MTERDEIECPACAEFILRDARKCRHCGEWIDSFATSHPRPVTNAGKVSRSPDDTEPEEVDEPPVTLANINPYSQLMEQLEEQEEEEEVSPSDQAHLPAADGEESTAKRRGSRHPMGRFLFILALTAVALVVGSGNNPIDAFRDAFGALGRPDYVGIFWVPPGAGTHRITLVVKEDSSYRLSHVGTLSPSEGVRCYGSWGKFAPREAAGAFSIAISLDTTFPYADGPGCSGTLTWSDATWRVRMEAMPSDLTLIRCPTCAEGDGFP